ncbi:DUF4301 family protein [Robertkochia marina]|uniref:DUF4301 family protein n=1 Tax=Robertkochia marina TaxID=1227945 RepID=A0A4S3M4A5_9FLAO|nr:DUF4301 family protein [Robertkochia marina]THD68997.1 DUF4301 family protein [Robertkochia marina]TRZ44820.1 DUF4301 family protein [Robertkochia marina]
MINLLEADLRQITSRGIKPEKIKEQIEVFKRGIPFVNLVAAATIDHGIELVTADRKEHYINRYEKERDQLDLLKFVPASGAATRMFKALFEFLNDYNPESETVNAYVNRTNAQIIRTFFVGVEKFPFYHELMEEMEKRYPDYVKLSYDHQKHLFVKLLLSEDGFDFGSFPKGLLPFHRYKTRASTAFEEHLYEAALYSSAKGKARLHFTISEEHLKKFEKEFKDIRKSVEEKTGVSFEISFSFQKTSTDTIAVTPDDDPFRLQNGDLLFRPGGHGALIENLNEQDADLIFIKNIDNVVVYKFKHEMADFKKMLAGKLLELREQVYAYSKLLDETVPDEATIEEIKTFLSEKLNVRIKPDVNKYKEIYQIEFLKEKLDAPIRVCGMVQNEGEPGGGPFWTKDENGNISLQIIESAQIDDKSKFQQKIFKESTHFNPVDIVCSIRNYKGEKYDLLKYIDHNQAFITNKTKEGKDLKALELPGLWNGAMAHWNTIFVEVPLITFNPAKTVVDLLKQPHQVRAL